jgi:cell division protein FtsL
MADENKMPVPGQRKKRRRRKKSVLLKAMSPSRVLFGTIVVGLCVALLYHQMHLTSLMKHINESELALEELKSEYVSLKTRKEQALSVSYVEEYAQDTLGMVKMDPAQVEYIEMTSPEVTEVSKSNATLGDAVANLMRSFTAVLEYLR